MEIEKIQRIRNDAKLLKIKPSDQVWARVEERLDRPRENHFFSSLKIIAVAASLLILLGIFLFQNKSTFPEPQKNFLVQDQHLFAPDDIQFIQNSYSLNTWKNIDEGKKGKKLHFGG